MCTGKYTGDDGSAMLEALTKCDTFSWCYDLKTFNSTMTRESWVGGTYSHPWGTGAITGIALGIMGIRQTSPAFQSFTVKPTIANMSHASMRVPSLAGFIDVSVNRTHTSCAVPCNTVASLCVPHNFASVKEASAHTFLLDGVPVADGFRTVDQRHICAQNVGCGMDGNARTVTIATETGTGTHL